MNGREAAEMIGRERMYLQNILKDFKAENGTFKPVEGMMNVAQQVNHIAHTVRWFREGAFGAGFDMDFEKIEAMNQAEISLEEALSALNAEYAGYQAFLAPLPEADLMAPMPPNAIFGEIPRVAALMAQSDHTAHHRGALSVYLRLLGVTPTMVYAE